MLMMRGKDKNSVISEIASQGGAGKGVVQHHEIGQIGTFLKGFGKSKDEATKSLLASSLQIIGWMRSKKNMRSDGRRLKKG